MAAVMMIIHGADLCDCRKEIVRPRNRGAAGKEHLSLCRERGGNAWDPLHVERGFAHDRSTVTVITINMNAHS